MPLTVRPLPDSTSLESTTLPLASMPAREPPLVAWAGAGAAAGAEALLPLPVVPQAASVATAVSVTAICRKDFMCMSLEKNVSKDSLAQARRRFARVHAAISGALLGPVSRAHMVNSKRWQGLRPRLGAQCRVELPARCAAWAHIGPA